MRQSANSSLPETGGGLYEATFTLRELGAFAEHNRTHDNIVEGIQHSVDVAKKSCVDPLCSVVGDLVLDSVTNEPHGVRVSCTTKTCTRKALTSAIGLTESSVDRLTLE